MAKKSREKKIEQMIEALVLDKLETEVHRRYQEGRKQIIKARRRTRRAEEKAKEESLLFLPPGEDDIEEAEIVDVEGESKAEHEEKGPTLREVASKTETKMDMYLHELGHDEREEEVKEGPFAGGQGD